MDNYQEGIIEISNHTISVIFFSMRPPNECPHWRTIASSRKAPLKRNKEKAITELMKDISDCDAHIIRIMK
jgi:hypothetical protein